jgi:hypothetical protein
MAAIDRVVTNNVRHPPIVNALLTETSGLVINDASAMHLLVGSELFAHLLDFLDPEAPFLLSLQSALIVCRLMSSRDVALMEAAFAGGRFFAGLQLVLGLEESPELLIGVQALGTLYEFCVETQRSDWMWAIRDQPWIPEEIQSLEGAGDEGIRSAAAALSSFMCEHP